MNTPNNGYIKIPNFIIGNLKGFPCVLYVYLLYLCAIQKTNSVKVSLETCRKRIGAAFIPNVCNQMHYLQRKGYVTIENNYNLYGMQKCNTITVNYADLQKDYFLLPSDHMFIGLRPAHFELLLTLYMFSFNDTYAIPSYNDIRKVSRLGPTTILQGYRVLEEKGIIKKENYDRRDGSNGHNRYFLITKIQRIIGKDTADKFVYWLSKRKRMRFEIWQAIRAFLAHEISFEKLLSYERSFYFCAENSMVTDQLIETTDNCLKMSAPGGECLQSVKRKLHKICDCIRHTVSKFFGKIRGVLLQS